MLTFIEFYKQITAWLLPLGYIETYCNPADAMIREYHFAKDGVRVICINHNQPYCCLSKHIFGHKNYTIKSQKFLIGTDQLDSVTEELNQIKLTSQPSKTLV